MLRRVTCCRFLQALQRAKHEFVRLPTRTLCLERRTNICRVPTTPACTVFRSPPQYSSYHPPGESPITDPQISKSQNRDDEPFAPEVHQNDQEVFNIDVLVALLRQENAQDICVIKVPPEMKYTEYFVVVSGTSTRHLRAMAFYAVKVYKFMRGIDDPHVNLEGKDADDWMCIDFGDIVVHFMLPQTRHTYELEKLWTLRQYDNQLSSIPPEILPEDFIFGTDMAK